LILPELYELFTNSKVNFILKKESNLNLSCFLKDWKARYIHPEYYTALEPNSTLQQVNKIKSEYDFFNYHHLAMSRCVLVSNGN